MENLGKKDKFKDFLKFRDFGRLYLPKIAKPVNTQNYTLFKIYTKSVLKKIFTLCLTNGGKVCWHKMWLFKGLKKSTLKLLEGNICLFFRVNSSIK